MANGLFDGIDDALWQLPRQISENGSGKHVQSTLPCSSIASISISSSSRKPLPLSLFGEQDDGEEEEKEEEAIAIDPVKEQEEDDDDEFGEFESVATIVDVDANPGNGKVAEETLLENGNGRIQLHEVGLGAFHQEQPKNELANGNGSAWAFPTPTSELMLAMHGIRAARPDQQLRFGEVAVEQYKLAAEERSSIDDDWGDFAECGGGGAAQDAKRNLQVDLIDLMSMSDDALVPAGDDNEQTSTDLLADNGAFSLMDSQLLEKNDSKPNGFDPSWGFEARAENQDAPAMDLFSTAPVSLLDSEQVDKVLPVPADLLWDDTARDVEQEQDVVPVSLLELDQDVPIATLDNETDRVSGLVDDLAGWDLDVPETKLETSSNFSRSISLPAPKPDLLDDVSSSIDSTAPVESRSTSHRRSRSSGGFQPSFAAIEEWSSFEEFATVNGAVASGDSSSKATAKQQENDRFESLWDTNTSVLQDEKQIDTANNDIADLLSLDWDYNAAGLAGAAAAADEIPVSTDKENAAAATIMEEMKPKYLQSWTLLARACAAELKLGLELWQDALSHRCSTQLVSSEQGGNYFTALTNVYRVRLLLGSTIKTYSSWLLPGSCDELLFALDESRLAWSEIEAAAAAAAAPPAIESLTRLETSLRSVDDSTPSLRCALSLLPLDAVPGESRIDSALVRLSDPVRLCLDVPLVVWDDQPYFLPVANLWANRVSASSPWA